MTFKFFKTSICYNRIIIIIIMVTILSIFFGYSLIKEPPVPSEFTGGLTKLEEIEGNSSPSFDMLMSHVYNMTEEPHPSGSEKIKEVRKYILSQIEKMGLKYEVQSFKRDLLKERLQKHYEEIENYPELAESRDEYAKKEGFDSFEDYYEYFFLGNTEYQNILVKIGPQNPKHKFLMMAHYDSTKFGPGAADDAVSVASLLEGMRVLSFKKDMKNAIYFLITDGEEFGLVGSDYFVKHPLLSPSEITLVTNFEARGNKGVPFIFRSSENNKNLLKIMSENIDKKCSFSWTSDIFKIMPHCTDLENFMNNGYKGLDFALGQGAKSNHTPVDNFKNLSTKSANQYLNTTINLINYFSTVDNIETDSDENAVAFPFAKGKIMVLSSFTMKIFGIVISILSFIFLIIAFIIRKYKIKDFLICIVAIVLSSCFAILLMFFQNRFIEMCSWSTIEIKGLFFISLMSLAVTSLFLLLAKKFFKIKNVSLTAVTILVFSILSAVLSINFNSASYIFSIPLLFILISAVFDMFVSNNILNLFFKSLSIFIFYTLFIPSAIIMQIAVPYYIFVFYILCIVGILPALSQLLTARKNNPSSNKCSENFK